MGNQFVDRAVIPGGRRMQVLVIATDTGRPQRLLSLLEQRGHEVACLAQPQLATAWLQQARLGLLILAVDAWASDAAALCAELLAARSGPAPPLIVWTERSEPAYLELLLAAGADDCLVAALDDSLLLSRLLVDEHWAHASVHAARPEACLGSTPFACCPLLQEMPYAVFRTTADGRFLEVNQTLVRMLGYDSKDELLALDLNRDLYCDPSVRTQILALPRDYVDGLEVAWKRKDGTVVTLHLAGRILRDERGKIILLEGIAEDVTPQKRTEAAFRDQIERNRLMLENSLEGFVICDLRGQLMEVNAHFCELSGYSRSELLAMDVTQLDAQLTPAEFEAALQEVARHGSERLSTRLRRNSGEIIDIEIQIRLGCFGQQELLFLFIHDVTVAKEAAARLRESEDRYRLIAENVTDAIWTAQFGGPLELPPQLTVEASRRLALQVMRQWQFTFISPSVQRLLGYTPSEILASNLTQLLTPEAYQLAAEQLAQQLRLDQRPDSDPDRQITAEIEHISKQGTPRCSEITVRFLRNAQGQFEAMLGVTRDITQRRQAEEAIQQEQDRLRQLLELHERDRQVLAMELHDEFAQQLTGAMMTLEAAWRMRSTAAERAEEQFQRGTDLLRKGIAYSRRLVGGLRPPSLDEFGLVPAIEHLISQHQAPGGPEIQFISKGHCRRLAQPLESAVFRIVQEALSNALRHSCSPRVYVELACTDSNLWITVQDWGIGFDATNLNKGGTGLEGIRERARLFGGQAILQAAPGNGTLVHVQLPLGVARRTFRRSAAEMTGKPRDGFPPELPAPG